MTIWIWCLCLVLAAVLGGVPFGRMLAHIFNNNYLADGTGNISPLAWAKMGKWLQAGLAAAAEVGKVIAAMAAGWFATFDGTLAALCGLVAVIGHFYSPFAKGRPCRTTAPLMGLWLAAHIGLGLAMGLLWLAVYHHTRRPHAATLLCLLTAPLIAMPAVSLPEMGAVLTASMVGLWHFRRFIPTRLRWTEPPLPVTLPL